MYSVHCGYCLLLTLSALSRFSAEKKKNVENFIANFSFHAIEKNFKYFFLAQLIELFHRTMKKKN